MAYICWCACLVGICGMHRFYIGKIGTGLLWVFTFGLLGIGQFIDLFTLGGQVDTYNIKYAALSGIKQQHITKGGHAHLPPAAHQATESEIDPKAVTVQNIRNIARRLQKIDRLFIGDLISEEEYEKQKNTILRELIDAVEDEYPEEGIAVLNQFRQQNLIDNRDYERVKKVLLA
jgi:hypothetical protein